MLLPFLEVDLTRDWQEHLIVCDASDAFGFGVALARAPKTLVREVGCLGQKRDRFVLGAKVITPTRSPSGSETARQYMCLWPKVFLFYCGVGSAQACRSFWRIGGAWRDRGSSMDFTCAA